MEPRSEIHTDPAFSIVVPTFRRPEALRATLAALAALDYDRNRVEVIVADDGADPLTAEIARRAGASDLRMEVIAGQQRGAATARNSGARVASGELLLFIDDDILVGPDHLQRHREAHRRHGDALINGRWEFTPAVMRKLAQTPFGRYRLELEERFQAEARGTDLGDGCVEMDLLGSWDLCIRRETFWQLGGFDADFPVAGAEDQDFSLRARRAGHRLLLDTTIRCLHNDDRVSLDAYCRREERSAQTMPWMARKHPDRFSNVPYVTENRPLARGDGPRLIVKKAIKSLLSTGPALASLHRLVAGLEAARTPDRVLRRLYSGLLGLHLLRGFRKAL
jgi:GT2 family glycosyltransferase